MLTCVFSADRCHPFSLRVAAVLTIVLIGFTLAAAPVLGGVIPAQIFFTDRSPGRVKKVNLDGTGLTTIVTGLVGPAGIDYDPIDAKLYWVDNVTQRVQRANTDGSGLETLIDSNLNNPVDVRIDPANRKIYWTDNGTQTIKRADMDGDNIELLVSGLPGVIGLDLDLSNGKMYWTDTITQKIQRANLDGSGVEDILTGIYRDVILDLPRNQMFFAGQVDIYKAALDGTGIQTVMTNPTGAPQSLEIDFQSLKLYWTDDRGSAERISRANLDGSNTETVVAGIQNPSGLVLVPEPATASLLLIAGTFMVRRRRCGTCTERNESGHHLSRTVRF